MQGDQIVVAKTPVVVLSAVSEVADKVLLLEIGPTITSPNLQPA